MGGSQSSPETRAEPVIAEWEIRHRRHIFYEFDEPWRRINWQEKAALINRLEEFSLCRPDVPYIKILVVGEVGAGKSSFINSVSSALQGHITSGALVDTSSASSSHSFTQRLKTHRVRSRANVDLPFAFCDIMGLESEAMTGTQPEDIINAVFGHVKDGYKFNKLVPLRHDSEYFKRNPDLSDKFFGVIYVLSASEISFTNEKLVEKLKIIRRTISDKGIPQIVVMTKVDEACPLVKEDLKKIYNSKKIKEKMELCCRMVGVPMNFIFPLKNYHEEIDTDDNTDVLILKAVESIVNIAHDRLKDERLT